MSKLNLEHQHLLFGRAGARLLWPPELFFFFFFVTFSFAKRFDFHLPPGEKQKPSSLNPVSSVRPRSPRHGAGRQSGLVFPAFHPLTPFFRCRARVGMEETPKVRSGSCGEAPDGQKAKGSSGFGSTPPSSALCRCFILPSVTSHLQQALEAPGPLVPSPSSALPPAPQS